MFKSIARSCTGKPAVGSSALTLNGQPTAPRSPLPASPPHRSDAVICCSHTKLEKTPQHLLLSPRTHNLRAGDNDFQRGYQAAPARPLLTPQQHTQQHGAGLEHGRVAAGATQYDQFNTPLPSAADVSSMSRWLACSYKAGLLGVAAYDRLSNEVCLGPCLLICK